MKPVLLPTPLLKANERLVEELNGLLKDAQDGKIKNICYVAWRTDETVRSYGWTSDTTKTLGALERMKYELLK